MTTAASSDFSPAASIWANAAATLALCATAAVPSLAYMRGAGSMSTGLSIVCGTILICALVKDFRSGLWRGTARASVAMLWSVAIAALSGAIAIIVHGEADAGRFFGSIVLLFSAGLAAVALSDTAGRMSGSEFDAMIFGSFWIFVVAGLAGLVHFSPFAPQASKAVLFFNEPSHYSLTFMPFFAYAAIRAKPAARLALIVAAAGLSLALESLTMIVGVMLTSLLQMRTRQIIMSSPIFFGVLSVLTLDYYTDRLNFSPDSTNFSSLVFLSGWERAWLGLRDTYGLGVGFQQFGVVGDQGRISDIILGLIGDRLNVLDGGTVGAKFVGEFGVFGIVLLAGFALFWIRQCLALRRVALDGGLGTAVGAQTTFAACCVAMFIIDIFVRGISYFSPSSLLFAASAFWLAGRAKALPICYSLAEKP